MKIFTKMKDGGQESTVTGYWLIESKKLFSICLLKFEGESRDAFHNHAFNSVSWLISGFLKETFLNGTIVLHKPSLKPFVTTRNDFHKVDSNDTSWVLTFRGPWSKYWNESINGQEITLSEGRKIVAR